MKFKTQLFYLLLILSMVSHATIESHHSVHSGQPAKILIETQKHSKYALIDNLENDTYAYFEYQNETRYSSSRMGNHGNYLIYLPRSEDEIELQIQSFEISQSSPVKVKIISLENAAHEIEAAIKKTSIAADQRLKHYFTGVDKRVQAIENYKQALAMFENQGEIHFAAICLFEMAVAQFELGNAEALNLIDKSRNYWSELNLAEKEIQTVNKKGLFLWGLQQLDAATKQFLMVKTYAENTGQNSLLANANNNLGLISWSKGRINKAKEHYNSALKANALEFESEHLSLKDLDSIKQNPQVKSIAATINNLALVYDALGSPGRAEDLWSLYIKLSGSLSDKNTIAKAQSNLAMLLIKKGDYEESLSLLNSAIRTFEHSNHAWIWYSVFNMGELYLKQGMNRLAELQFIRVIEGAKSVNNKELLMESRLKLIDVYFKQNKLAEVEALNSKILAEAKDLQSTKFLSLAHMNVFKLNKISKDFDSAAANIGLALEKSKGKIYKRLHLKMNLENAKLLYLQGDFSEAISLIQSLLDSIKSSWDVALLNEASELMSLAYYQKEDHSLAETVINEELNRIQWRVDSTSSNKIHSNMLRQLKSSLHIYSLIMIKQGKPEAGFVRTNDLLDRFYYVQSRLGKTHPSNGTEEILNEVTYKLEKLENTMDSSSRSQIENDVLELKAKLELSLKTNRTDRYPSLQLNAIQNSLGENELLIQYSMGSLKGIAWWISKNKVSYQELPATEELSELVKNYRDSLLQSHKINNSDKRSLEELLSPLKSFNDISKIHLITDGPLSLMPFESLKDPRKDFQKPLLETSMVSRLASARSLISLKSESKPKEMTALVLADPVTTVADQRLVGIDLEKMQEHQAFPRLIHTSKEAFQIQELIPAKVLTGFQANKKALNSENIEHYNILHFASHAFLNDDIPALSSLVLSRFNQSGQEQPNFLRAFDINHLNLSADLVVLSGCETGVNGKNGSFGFEGLTQSFLNAGAKSLIASLWKVDDLNTRKLMTYFYQFYAQGDPVDLALSKAKRKVYTNPRTRHPKYWAGWYLVTNS